MKDQQLPGKPGSGPWRVEEERRLPAAAQEVQRPSGQRRSATAAARAAWAAVAGRACDPQSAQHPGGARRRGRSTHSPSVHTHLRPQPAHTPAGTRRHMHAHACTRRHPRAHVVQHSPQEEHTPPCEFLAASTPRCALPEAGESRVAREGGVSVSGPRQLAGKPWGRLPPHALVSLPFKKTRPRRRRM